MVSSGKCLLYKGLLGFWTVNLGDFRLDQILCAYCIGLFSLMVTGFLVNDARNSRSDFRSDMGFLCAICIVNLGFRS